MDAVNRTHDRFEQAVKALATEPGSALERLNIATSHSFRIERLQRELRIARYIKHFHRLLCYVQIAA